MCADFPGQEPGGWEPRDRVAGAILPPCGTEEEGELKEERQRRAPKSTLILAYFQLFMYMSQ